MTDYVIGPNGPTTGSAFQAIQSKNRKWPPITIYNTGTATVYLSDDTPVESSDGIPLTAGSVIPWDEDLPLYAVCPTSTTITTSSNSGVGFDAGAIAAQLIAQGLTANAIAAAIKIAGTPPIDTNALLVQLTNPNNGTGIATSLIDVSAYQSISIAATGLADPSNSIRIDVNWCDSAGTLIFREDIFVGTAGMSDAAMSVRGPKVYFGIVINLVGAPATIKVYGSYKAIASNFVQIPGYGEMGNGQLDGTCGQGFQTWYGTIPISTSWVCQFDNIAGPCKIIMRYVSANTSGVTRLVRIPNALYSLTTYLAETSLPTVAGQMQYDELFLPPLPIEMSLQNTSATQTLAFRATIVWQRPWAA